MLTAETKQAGLHDHELGVIHVLGEGGLAIAKGAKVRENFVANALDHLIGGQVLED
jgi:hypothetical protein